MASAVCAGFPRQPFDVEFQKTDDSATVMSTQSSVVIGITSRSGTGGVRLIRRTNAKWPPRLTIRLAVRSLESFGMRNGRIHFSASPAKAGAIPYWRTGTNEGAPETAAGTLNLTMTATDDGIEINVPPEITAGDPAEIGFRWTGALKN